VNAVTFPVRVDPAALQSEAREKALGLRELRYFLSVAETGNVGRAARVLNVSQPAVSLQLRKLEEGLGTQLVLRHGRGVTLTPAGACLRDRLNTVMRLLASPLDDAGYDASPRAISFAVTADAAAALLTQVAKAFRLRWPDATLDIREGSGADLEEWVLHRHVDLVVLQDPPSLADLEVLPVLVESLDLVVPPHSPVADNARPLSLRELVQDALILPGEQHWIRRRLDHAAQQSGVRLNPALQVNSIALAKAMVRNGLGCTILPRAAVQDEVARGALAVRRIGHPSLSYVRGVAFHRAASNSPVAAFARVVRDEMVALAESGARTGAQIISPGSNTMDRPRQSGALAVPAWHPAEEAAIG
jgi:LysR family nitrogen assimilation transcriptional regulator